MKHMCVEEKPDVFTVSSKKGAGYDGLYIKKSKNESGYIYIYILFSSQPVDPCEK